MLRSDTPIFTFRGPMGVRVEVSGSIFFLALIFFGLGATSADALVQGAILFGMVVTSIFLHEYGHAWGAKVQGVRVDKIVLHGGVAIASYLINFIRFHFSYLNDIT